MSDKFDDILNASLERLIAKGESLHDILKSYPENASRLEPLLKTAVIVSRTVGADPGAEFKGKALSGFQASAVAAQKDTVKRGFAWPWARRRAWVMAGSIILAVMVAAGTTAFAAAASMPDEPLYPVKLATEQIRTVVTSSSLGKAKLEARLAEKRIEELSYMINKDNSEVAERVSERLYRHYSRIEKLVQDELANPEQTDSAPGKRPVPKPQRALRGDGKKAREMMELKKMLHENYPKNEAALRKIEAKAQKLARPGFRKSIERSLKSYQRAVVAAEEETGQE